MKSDTSKVVKGALLLTLAGIISKILSAGYRIPLQNLTGDLGFYTYQQIYPFIGLMMILSVYGLPSAVSKLAAESTLANRPLTIRSFYGPVLIVMMGMSVLLCVSLYMIAPYISSGIGDVHLTRAYRLVAFACLLIPFVSLGRGVFQAEYYMAPTAISQMGEQLFRVSVIIIGACLVASGQLSVYVIGDVAAIASIGGMLIALLLLLIFFRRKQINHHERQPISWLTYTKTLLVMGLIASCHHLILILIQMIDVFTIVPALIDYGLTSLKAKEMKGVFDRGFPLIQVGTVIGSSFALSFIPAVAKRKSNFQHIFSGLKVCIYIAWGATIGLMIMFPEVNLLLFQDTKGTMYLQLLSLSILLCSIIITGISILQAMNQFIRSASYMIVALLIKWLLNVTLVPIWGVVGSAIATVTVLLVLCLFVLIDLKKNLPYFSLFKQLDYWALFWATIMMVSFITLMKWMWQPLLMTSRFGLLIYVVAVVLIGGLIYILRLIRSGVWTEQELESLPVSSIWNKFLKRSS